VEAGNREWGTVMANSDDALDAYASGVWDAIAYVNEFHRTALNPLHWEEVLTAIERAREREEL
jgi:hypothetical protein